MLDDLESWILGAVKRDLNERWPFLYYFFTTAQLPGFVKHLHSLAIVSDGLSGANKKLLEQGWEQWPLLPPPVNQCPPSQIRSRDTAPNFL